MKINIYKILLVTAALFVSIFTFITPQVSAQMCTGSINCKKMGIETRCEGGLRDGEECSSDSYCLCTDCCKSKEVVVARDTKSCITPGKPGCGAGCLNEGSITWQPDGGSCNLYYPPPVIVPAPVPSNAPQPSTPPAVPPPPAPVCGCQFGYTCCPDGGCVPPGNCCGDCGGCNSISSYSKANVWVRVVSPEGPTGTTAWKGTQTNDPLYGINWSVQETDSQGYFQQYRPYESGGVTTFDKTKNKIDPNMKLVVSTNPSGWYTYTNSCGDGVGSNIPATPAHGLAWSNHFCSAGYAYSDGGTGKPLKNQKTCGDYYYTNMSGSCGSSPDLLPTTDRDGCWGLFAQPQDGPETVPSYHESIVPLLEEADPNTWADLRYEGYWSAAYQAWDHYDQTSSLQSVITLTPPTNHSCADVRWWGKQEIDRAPQEYSAISATSNADGTCTFRFNPEKGGNLIVIELSATKVAERCTVQLEAPYSNPDILTSNLNIDSHEGFVAHVVGESTEYAPPIYERAHLWLAKTDFTQLTGLLPQGFVEVLSGGKYYYKLEDSATPATNCFTNSENACSMSVEVTNTAAVVSGLSILDTGNYHVFCDVAPAAAIPGQPAPTDPTSNSNCSGNPLCSTNGGSVNCGSYKDCELDSLNPHDHATLTVSCKPQCNNVCAASAYDDGCGNPTGCAAGTQFGPPGTITITDPYRSEDMNSKSAPNFSYNVGWTISEADKTDNFDVFTYPQNKYADITAVETAYTAGASDIYYKKVPAVIGQQTYTTTVNTLADQGWKLTTAVRANNITCGTPQASVAYNNYDLISGISGQIKAVTTNQCSGGSDIGSGIYPALTNASQVVVTDTNDQVPYFQSQSIPNGDASKGYFSGSNYFSSWLPFLPQYWGKSLVPQLKLTTTPSNASYICAACNRVNGDAFTCQPSSGGGQTYVPQQNVNFYVQLIDLSNSAWWQTWGGNVFGKNKITSNSPDACTSGVGCTRGIIANISTQANSAGVPISNGVVESAGGFYSANVNIFNAAYSNPYAANTSSNFAPTLENYSYFLVNSDLPVPANPSGPATQISANITTAAELQTAFGSNYRDLGSNGEKVVWVTGDLTVNLGDSSGKWNVPAGERWVVFVPGNLTFTGPSSDHLPATQQGLIKVTNGGFLAFISKGNITFNPDLGYGYDDETSVASFNTPIVEGVYIASNFLVIQSKNSGIDSPSDYKFVGAGTFVGLNGVNLERKFDDGGARRALNNTSPTDLFIYRPDFMINSPQFLQKATVDWKEVD